MQPMETISRNERVQTTFQDQNDLNRRAKRNREVIGSRRKWKIHKQRSTASEGGFAGAPRKTNKKTK
jgi:hypothetical protein